MTFAVLVAMGLVVGIFSGLLGVGGGLLIIPGMLYLYPLLLPEAAPLAMSEITGIAAVQSLMGGFSATLIHHKKGNTDLKLILCLGVLTMLGAYAGSVMTPLYPDRALKMVYITLLGITLYVSAFYKKHPVPAQATPKDPAKPAFRLNRSNIPFIIPAGLVIGYFSGLLGIGGAILLIPMLHTLLGTSMRLAIGSSAGLVFLTSIMSVIGKAQAALLPMPHAILIALGAIIGGNLGAKLSARMSENALKILFLTIISLTLLRLLLEVIQ